MCQKQKKQVMSPELIAGLAQGLASTGNAMAQQQANNAQMFYNDQQYARQRKDALADWTMQNEYNSPSAQMARYKDAGLNPNLIYGQMTTSPAIRSSDMPNAHLAPVNPTQGIAEGLSKYMDTSLQKAQVDNLKKQNDVLTQDILLKTAEVLGKGYANSKMALELQKQPELLQTTLDGMKANVRKTLIDTGISQDVNERQQQLHPSNLAKAVQDVSNAKSLNALTQAQRSNVLQTTQNLKTEGVIKKLDAQIASKGIRPGDPIYARAASYIHNWAQGKSAMEIARGAQLAITKFLFGIK